MKSFDCRHVDGVRSVPVVNVDTARKCLFSITLQANMVYYRSDSSIENGCRSELMR